MSLNKIKLYSNVDNRYIDELSLPFIPRQGDVIKLHQHEKNGHVIIHYSIERMEIEYDACKNYSNHTIKAYVRQFGNRITV